MPAKKIVPPAVQTWIDGLKPSLAQQYPPVVRQFLEGRAPADLASISASELASFVLTRKASTRNKVISALKHFSGTLAVAGDLTPDPGWNLQDVVRNMEEQRSILAGLVGGGLSPQLATSCSWRDIVPLTLGGAKPLDVTIDDASRVTLTKALLERLRSVTETGDLAAVLDSPILSNV